MRMETALNKMEELAAKLQKRAEMLRNAKPRGKPQMHNAESMRMIHQHHDFLMEMSAKFSVINDGAQDAIRRR